MYLYVQYFTYDRLVVSTAWGGFAAEKQKQSVHTYIHSYTYILLREVYKLFISLEENLTTGRVDWFPSAFPLLPPRLLADMYGVIYMRAPLPPPSPFPSCRCSLAQLCSSGARRKGKGKGIQGVSRSLGGGRTGFGNINRPKLVYVCNTQIPSYVCMVNTHELLTVLNL